MNGVFRSVKIALLAGTFLSANSAYAEDLVPLPMPPSMSQLSSASAQETGEMSLDDLPPLEENDLGDDGAFDDENPEMPPLPDMSAEENLGSDNRVFSFDEPLADDDGPSIFDDMPQAAAPAMPPAPMDEAEGGDSESMMPPPLPGESASEGSRAAQEAEDMFGEPVLPADTTEIFDIFSDPEPVVEPEPEPVKPAPAPEPKKVTKPVVKKAEPVVKLPKEYRLPSTIYKKEYSRDNGHLPQARYEHEYDAQMFMAVANNRVETVRSLLNTGRNIEMRNAEGDTPLLYAIRNRAQNMVRMLLGKGSNPNAANDRGITALHYAMIADSPQMVSALLEMGADPNMPDPQGVTPLMFAASKKNPAYTHVLIRHQAEVNLPSFDGRSPLHVAAETNNAEAAAFLIEAGADINAQKLRGYTPLMSAAAAGADGVASLLLNAGADMDARDHLGRSAAEIARARNHPAIADRIMTAAIKRERAMSSMMPVDAAPLAR